MVSHEKVSELEAEIHQESFEDLIRVEQEAKIEAPQDVLFDEWSEIIPANNYGTVTLVSVSEDVLRTFKKDLISGENTISNSPNGNSQLDLHLDSRIQENGYEGIYRAKKGLGDNENRSDDDIVATQHSSSFLKKIEDRLVKFKEEIKTADVPDQYKEEYARLVLRELQYIEAARVLGTPEFTRLQKSVEEWTQFIDVDASIEHGMIMLPFETQARQVLIRNKYLRKEMENVTMGEALSIFNFNDSEREYLGFDEIEDAHEMDSAHIQIVFELLMNRVGIQDYAVVIDKNSAAINVNHRAKKVSIPDKRNFTGMEARYISSHELMHVIRGKNGSNQGLKILGEGVDDYYSFEEGLGVVAEMIMGEPFGHTRQVEFAARYLAVSMALKARITDEGKPEPVYTTQEIFNELVDHGLNEKVAAVIVWRVMRGTSLKRKTLFIDVLDNSAEGLRDEAGETVDEVKDKKVEEEIGEKGKIKSILVAECYVKDTAYFEGQPQVFQWIMDHVPLKEGLRESATLNSPDFSDKFLARIGLSREAVEGMEPEIKEHALRYSQLVQLGRKTLIDIINVLGAGKMRLDFLNDDSEWFDLLRFGKANGMIDYSDILRSKEFLNPKTS